MDSALGNHSSDFVDLGATADHQSSSAPKSTKSTTSTTAKPATAVQGEAAAGFFRNPRILEEDKHAQSLESTFIVIAKPFRAEAIHNQKYKKRILV